MCVFVFLFKFSLNMVAMVTSNYPAGPYAFLNRERCEVFAEEMLKADKVTDVQDRRIEIFNSCTAL